MAYTDVDIANIALARIGVDRTIASMDEQSKEARNCKRFYPFARDVVLEAQPWPFAIRAKALAPVTPADLIPGWSNAYSLPADAASLIEVVPAGEVSAALGHYVDCSGPWAPPRRNRYSFRRALSDDGTLPVVLANVPDAYGVYVSKVANTGAFSTMMVSLIADRLAMEISMPLTVDPRWFSVAQERFQAAMADTASREYDQEQHGADPMPPSIRARG